MYASRAYALRTATIATLSPSFASTTAYPLISTSSHAITCPRFFHISPVTSSPDSPPDGGKNGPGDDEDNGNNNSGSASSGCPPKRSNDRIDGEEGNGNGEGPPQSDKSVADSNTEPDIKASIASEPTTSSRLFNYYGSARARARRSREADEFPPLELPRSFIDNDVFPADENQPRILHLLRELARYRNNNEASWFTLSHLLTWVDQFQCDWSVEEVSRWALVYTAVARVMALLSEARLRPSEKVRKLHHSLRPQLCRVNPVSSYERTAMYLALRSLNDQHLESSKDELANFIRRGKFTASDEQPISYLMYQHLKLTLMAQMEIKMPQHVAASKSRRRICFLYGSPEDGHHPCNYGMEVMRWFACETQCDLVNLNAQTLGHVVGGYLGQSNAWAPGSISQLGYSVSRLKGHLFEPRGSIDANEGAVMVLGDKPDTVKELFLGRQGSRQNSDDGVQAWDRLKVKLALDVLVHAADTPERKEQKPLLVHVDDYIELTMVPEGEMLLDKLSAIVDDIWRSGRPAILVGSSVPLKQPSPEYTAALQRFSATNLAIDVPVEPTMSPTTSREAIVNQNYRNLVATLEDLGGQKVLIEPSHFESYVKEKDCPPGFFDVVLPLPTIYHIATLTLLSSCKRGQDAVQLMDLVRAIDHFPAHDRLREKTGMIKSATAGRAREEIEKDAPKMKVDEYEAKIIPGLIRSKEITTTFADVHTAPGTVESLRTLTTMSLERPDAFSYGILANEKIGGCLLYGPPGTGKTLLARALARESKAHVLEVSGASVHDMWVGNSEKNVRAIFTLARKLSPCIVFIDEADALFAVRSRDAGGVRRETLNQFLREWDGVMPDKKTFVMLATNRPFDLDEAVLRRVPRRILVDLPLAKDREAILAILLKDETLGDDVSLVNIAAKTPFYSGSDLKNMCVAAAMASVKEENAVATAHTGPEPYVYPERRVLKQRHFDKAMMEVTASIGEDMESLTAIRKFDIEYGTGRKKNNKWKRTMGFGGLPMPEDADGAVVRKERERESQAA